MKKINEVNFCEAKSSRAGFCGATGDLLRFLILTALAVPGAAVASDATAPQHTITANVGVVSNYVFRGITQTVDKPALQGGFDYARAGGFYAGIWGSNVSWITGSGATGNASLELDTYAGFKNSFAGDFTYDVGFIRYNYSGDYTPPATYEKADTDEIYGAIGYKWVTVKYSYALGKFLTVPEARGTSYFEVNASYPVADSGITLGAHYGRQDYKGSFTEALDAANLTPTYTDYKLNITKDFSGYVLGLAYTNTNARKGGYYTYTSTSGVTKDWGRDAVVLSLTRSF